MECRLSYSEHPWQCSVKLCFTVDERGRPLEEAQKIPFGDTIFNKGDVEDRIKSAQRAILNNSTPANCLLDSADEEQQNTKLTFSSNYVSLDISGNDVTDLSFRDLPGMDTSITTHSDIHQSVDFLTHHDF